MYDLVVAVHVVAAVIGFGATFTYPVIQLTAERRRPAALPFAFEAILTISRYVAVPAALVVGATGAYQVADGPYELADAWVALAVVLYVAVLLVATVYLAPRYRRAQEAAEHMLASAGSAALSAEYRAAVRGTNAVGPAVAAAVLAIVVLMVVKPG